MNVYDSSSPERNFDHYLVLYRYKHLLSMYKKAEICVELGCGSGFQLDYLKQLYRKIIIIEKNEKSVEISKSRVSDCRDIDITFVCDDWLNISDILLRQGVSSCDIIFFEGIEYLNYNKAESLLKKAKKFLGNGRLHLVASNRLSFHRRLGFYIGILRDLDSLEGASEFYSKKEWLSDMYRLRNLLNDSGYSIISTEPHFLKILPNNYLSKLPTEVIEALFTMGKELPEYCAEIYICATPKL